MLPYLRISFLILSVLTIFGCKKNDNGLPTNLSVSPTIDTVGGVITLSGSGFSLNPNENIVMFNDSMPGQVITATSTQLTVMVPGWITKGRITVRNNNMASQTAELFQIAPKFFPLSAGTGYPISIITGGGENISDYRVSFNGTETSPTSFEYGILKVNVPAGARNGNIIVYYKGEPYTSFTNFTLSPVGTVTRLTAKGVFSSPKGLAFDQNDNLFVADLNGGVIDKINLVNGSVIPNVGDGSWNFNGGSPLLSAGIYGAFNLAFAPNGNLYATNIWYGPIWKITTDSVTGLLPPGQLYSPAGIFIDASGTIFITHAQSIKKITPDGVVTTLAGSTQGIENGPVATATFSNPTSLTLDDAGNIFVADNTQIRLISKGHVSTFAGGGGNGAYTDGKGMLAGFIMTASIIRDPRTGNFFVTDPGAHVVRMINPDGVVTTIAGRPGVQGDQNGTGPDALFEGPEGIAMDKDGNLFVSDGAWDNSSIKKIQVY